MRQKNTESDEAHEQDRTVDLILTKNVLYRLSYMGKMHRCTGNSQVRPE